MNMQQHPKTNICGLCGSLVYNWDHKCSENNGYTEVKIKQEVKPPIGVTPRFVWVEKRMHELGMAIMRYIEAWKKIPVEWVTEYNELQKELERK